MNYFFAHRSTAHFEWTGPVGSLEVGRRADLVVVDQNLFEIDPAQIHNTKALLTRYAIQEGLYASLRGTSHQPDR